MLHTIDSLRMGGAEALLAALVRELHALGVESHVRVASSLGADPALASSIASHAASFSFLEGRRFYDPRLLRGLRRALSETEATVVHSHLCVANVNSRLAARSRGRVHLTTIHTPPGRAMEDTLRCALADGLTARLSRVLIAPSPEVADAYRRWFRVPSARLRVIPNGPAAGPPAPGDRESARAELLGGAAGPLIVCVSRLQPEKGIAELVDATAALHARHPGLRVAIAGQGPAEQELRARIGGAHVDGVVTLLGHRGDVPRLLAAADVFCLPSRHEGLPLTLLEAMTAGLPIVVTAVGGIPAAVGEGRCAALVPPGDAPALAAAIDRLVGDPAAAAALGDAARREAAERFSIGAVARRYADVYRELQGPGRSP